VPPRPHLCGCYRRSQVAGTDDGYRRYRRLLGVGEVDLSHGLELLHQRVGGAQVVHQLVEDAGELIGCQLLLSMAMASQAAVRHSTIIYKKNFSGQARQQQSTCKVSSANVCKGSHAHVIQRVACKTMHSACSTFMAAIF
jgi:hypothetical protein